jgi:mRNA-degrading endonuclease toxin of MazEF toxin-antitoxin module
MALCLSPCLPTPQPSASPGRPATASRSEPANAASLIVVVPFSSSVTPSRLRPQVGPETGIENYSAAICRAVRGVARSRLLRHLGEVDNEAMAEIEVALGLVLGTA